MEELGPTLVGALKMSKRGLLSLKTTVMLGIELVILINSYYTTLDRKIKEFAWFRLFAWRPKAPKHSACKEL